MSDEDLSILSRAARDPDLVLRYGPLEDQVADVYLPPQGMAASKVTFLLHGGFWRQAYDRTHTRPHAVELTRGGSVVVMPEYRRVDGRGGWPETFDDMRAISGLLPGLLAEAVPGTGDKPVTLSGHSAGGHLALWLAAVAPPVGLADVLVLAPIANLHAAHEAGLGGNAALALMRVPPEEDPGRWREADPSRLPTPTVPVTIFHGRRDTVVPIGQSYGYRVSHPKTRIAAFDCGHFELIDRDARVGGGDPAEHP